MDIQKYARTYYRSEKRQARIKQRADENRDIIRRAKDIPCADCNHIFHYSAMEFDHLPGSEKKYVIAQRGLTISKPLLLAEIAKCEVVCSNCHHIRTWVRLQKT